MYDVRAGYRNATTALEKHMLLEFSLAPCLTVPIRLE
jgi:hypothetical protein